MIDTGSLIVNELADVNDTGTGHDFLGFVVPKSPIKVLKFAFVIWVWTLIDVVLQENNTSYIVMFSIQAAVLTSAEQSCVC